MTAGITAKKINLSRRVKTPTVLQMEAVECGAAALSIVLGYLGKQVPLEELRVACGVSRDGSKAGNIVRAAKRYGLQARGYRKETDKLATLPLPLIVHWEFNHFLVVEGFRGDKIYLNDPASGPRTTSYEEFDKSFTGVVLTFEPTAEFQKSGQTFNLLQALRERARGSEKALLFVALAGISLVVPGLLIPAFSQIFVDYYLVRNLQSWLAPLLLGMGLTALLRGFLSWLKGHYLLRLENKLAVTMSSRFFWHLLHLPLPYYQQRYAGEIAHRLTLNDEVATLLSGKLASTALDIVTILFYAIILFSYDWLLALIGVTFAALNLVALRYISRRRTDLNQRLLQERSKLMGVAMNGLTMIETLKATGRESEFYSRWAGYHAKVSRADQEINLYNQFLGLVPPFLTSLTVAAVLSLGGLRVLSGELSLGMLVAFQSLMLSFLAPINNLVALGSILQDTEGNLKRLDDVLKNPTEAFLSEAEQIRQTQPQTPKLSGQLELRHLTFGYSPLEAPLIEDFSLSLKPGQRVALVGGSGSGKSTVARLVAGLYQPWRGEILFDGQPRNAVPRRTLTNSLGMVNQDIFLFEGTVKDNLTNWDTTVSEADIIQAARDACIHEDITSRPGAFGSRVAEGGTNFSGGQRQRLEIARALVNNPSILVLDEATSALDPVTEKLIDENLRRRGCTCLIIAHRLSTIRDCDEIIVMERGKIVQRGTHQEMMEQDGPYAHLISVSDSTEQD